MLADITGKTIETVDSPQNIGAVGAAIVIAVGVGLLGDITDAKKLIPATKSFKPNFALKPVYDRNYKVFKALYKANKENFAILNEDK